MNNLPVLPEPLKEVSVAGYHDGTLKEALENYYDEEQMRAILGRLTAAQAEADRLRVDAERLIAKWRDESKVFANIGNQFDAGESWALAKCADDLDTALHAAKTEQENTMELSMNATDAISQHFDDRPVNTEHPLFERIWQAIKGWDIQRVNGAGYAGANGTDVQVIIDAIEQP